MGNNTATITPDAETTAVETITAATGELLHIDPAELVLDDNVRTDPVLGKDFIASIATGVRLPLYAVRDADGTVKVRDGQRRMLAAREAGLTSIPVYVVAADQAESDDTERTRRRIIDQVIANEARADLKASEKAAAVEQLSLTGLSATKIAKSLHTNKKTVDAALATAASQTARSAVDAANLTLDQGMILAEYDDDPEAVAELVAAAAEGRFDHKAAELKETAPARAAIRAARDELTAQGFTVTTDRSDVVSGYRRLDQLVDAEGSKATVADLDPDHLLALLSARWRTEYTSAEGVALDRDDIDWDLDGEEDADLKPEEGYHDPRTVTRTESCTAEVVWFHRCYEEAGLLTAWEWDQQNRSSKKSTPKDRPLTEAEQAHKDAETRERRKVKTLNKLGVAAQTVRRDKLTEAFGRKTLPKGKAAVVAAFLATTMWHNADLYNLTRQDANAKEIATDLLGGDPIEALDGATGERAQLIALAITCAAHEANLPKDAWRGGHEYLRSIGEGRTRYLTFLTEAFGYALSDIEKVVTGDMNADDINIS